MQLRRLLADEFRTPADLHLRTRHRLVPRHRIALGGHQRRIDRHRPCLLQQHQHIDRAMLQRLETADRHAKLLSGFQIFNRQLDQRIHRPHRLGA